MLEGGAVEVIETMATQSTQKRGPPITKKKKKKGKKSKGKKKKKNQQQLRAKQQVNG